jgi:hypothetical protein
MFIITVPKLAVDEMVVSAVPELGRLSNPIKMEALF